MNNFYVYVCYVEGTVKYVGRGKSDRYKHCTSGISANKELNQAYFEGKHMETVIVRDNMTKAESEWLESEIILNEGLENLFNKINGKSNNRINDWYSVFKPYLSSFYENVILSIIEKGNSCHISELKKMWSDFMEKERQNGKTGISEFHFDNKKLIPLLNLEIKYIEENNKKRRMVFYKGDKSINKFLYPLKELVIK